MVKETLAVQMGQNIQHLRKARGLTQAQLAEKINVSTAFISRVERGDKLISVKTLSALVDTFHVSYDTIFREPSACTDIEAVRTLLEGRPPSYVAWAAKLLQVCGEIPWDAP